MARVTVEDCVEKVENRFDLVMLAAQRSRDISAGGSLTLDRDNDKNPVVALREIADESIDLEALMESVVRGMQRHVEIDEPEEDETMEMMALTGDRFGEILEAGAAVAGDEDADGEAEGDAETSDDTEDDAS